MSKYQHTQPEQTKIAQKRVKRLSTDIDYLLLMRIKLLCVQKDLTYQELLESLFTQLLDGKMKLPEGDAKNQTHFDL